MPPLRILAFEPFDAGSHRAVRESISRRSRHHWTWLTLPGRAWKWRMRLGAIELIEHARRGGRLAPSFDAIFLTSLMSAADLRALLPKHLRSTPLCLYMHENQAAYPQGHVVAGPGAHDVQFALTNLISLLAADLVIWNSRWNQESFTRGMASILKHAPSPPMPDWKDRIESRSRVIWPPVEPPPESPSELPRGSLPEAIINLIDDDVTHVTDVIDADVTGNGAIDGGATGGAGILPARTREAISGPTAETAADQAAPRVLHNAEPADSLAGRPSSAAPASQGERASGPFVTDAASRIQAPPRPLENSASPIRLIRVVWPHRWEHDKGPDRLLAIARRWSQSLDLRWTLLGEQFRTTPPELTQFQSEFRDRIDYAGYEPDRARYFQRLASCDWVLTTTRHEFFGIAMVEAMLCGCLPWIETDEDADDLLGGGTGVLPGQVCGTGVPPVQAGGTGVSPVLIRRAEGARTPPLDGESTTHAGGTMASPITPHARAGGTPAPLIASTGGRKTSTAREAQQGTRRLGFSYDELLPPEAKHLHPSTLDSAATEAQSVRRKIRKHLEKAAAPAAVGLIDDAMAAMAGAI